MSNNKKTRITDLTSRLFEFIERLSDKDKLELLKTLEEKKSGKERTNLRKLCCVDVNFSDENQIYKGLLHDISDSGAFIKTDQLFNLGDKISINMPELSEMEKSILVGEIKRTTKDGIGIQFYIDTKKAEKESQLENE